jgi:hypothetical protein
MGILLTIILIASENLNYVGICKKKRKPARTPFDAVERAMLMAILRRGGG